MIRKIDDEMAGSLFGAAIAEVAAKDDRRAESDSAAGALAGKDHDGSDPYTYRSITFISRGSRERIPESCSGKTTNT